MLLAWRRLPDNLCQQVLAAFLKTAAFGVVGLTLSHFAFSAAYAQQRIDPNDGPRIIVAQAESGTGASKLKEPQPWVARQLESFKKNFPSTQPLLTPEREEQLGSCLSKQTQVWFLEDEQRSQVGKCMNDNYNFNIAEYIVQNNISLDPDFLGLVAKSITFEAALNAYCATESGGTDCLGQRLCKGNCCAQDKTCTPNCCKIYTTKLRPNQSCSKDSPCPQQ